MPICAVGTSKTRKNSFLVSMEHGHGHASEQWCGITLNAIYVHSGGGVLEHGESIFVLLGPGDHSLIVWEGVDLPESLDVPNQIIMGRSGGDMKALLITP